MKGGKLYINIFIVAAILLGLIMAIMGTIEAVDSQSWSQFAGKKHDPMLYSTLLCISWAFLISSFEHPDKLREITKLPKNTSIRLEHLNRLTSVFFGGVIAFSVNNEISIVETLHLVFTGLAILSGYTATILYPESRKGKIWSLIGFVIGAGGFLGAFLFHWYSIAWGEVIAAIPLAIQMYITLNKK